MNVACHAARGAARLLLAWLLVLIVAPVRAQVPACVDLWLPARLPARESWQRLLLQETKPLLSDAGGVCAQLDILQENGESGALTLQVGWLGKVRKAPLVLTDVPAQERPRTGALLARGMLQQLVQESLAPSDHEAADQVSTGTGREVKPGTAGATIMASATATTAAAPAAGQQTRAPMEHAPAAGEPLAQSHLPKSARSAQPAKRPEPAPVAAQARADRDDDKPGPSSLRSSAWSGSALMGAALVLNSFSALQHCELGVQRSFLPQRLRIGLALLAELAIGRMSAYPMKLAGPGVRVGVDLLLTKTPRRRVWLGLGANTIELILKRQSVDPATIAVGEPVPTVRSNHTVFGVDLRPSVEIAFSRRNYFLIALELAYGVYSLDVRRNAKRVAGYAGPMVGLRLGVSF